MVVASSSPPPPPVGSPIVLDPPAPVRPQNGTAVFGSQETSRGSTTAWLRMWGGLAMAVIVAFGVAATIAAFVMQSATSAIEDSTAPTLVGVQDLFASVAEANAAATGTYLSGASGTEDRSQRNLYLEALQRAGEKSEDVSSLVGRSGESHDALKAINTALTRYSGEVEAARLGLVTGQENSDQRLRQAIDEVGSRSTEAVAVIVTDARERLDDESNQGKTLATVVVGLGVLALIILLSFQWALFKRTNRLLNLGLVAATLLVAFAIVQFSTARTDKTDALDSAAEGGLNSILATSDAQNLVFGAQSEISLELLGLSDADALPALLSATEQVDRVSSLADSPREEAATTELSVRMKRYNDAAVLVLGNEDGRGIDAARVSILSAFNGVNTSIDSVLSDNRRQFLDNAAVASDAVRSLPWWTILIPVLALLAAGFGLQQRLREYG